MIASYIIHFIFLSISPLTSCLCNIQCRRASNCPAFCCNSFSWMLHVSCVKASIVVQIYTMHSHPSNRVSFSLITSLGSSLRVRARLRVTGRSWACLFLFRFQFRSIFLSLFFFSPSFSFVIGDWIWSCAPSERMPERKCRPFFPKTTVPWLVSKVSY